MQNSSAIGNPPTTHRNDSYFWNKHLLVMAVVNYRVSTYDFTKAFVLLLGLMAAIIGATGPVYGKVYVADPGNYRSLLGGLKPGDTLSLEAGNYAGGLSISNLHGEAGNPIVITGPETGAPAIILGDQGVTRNTVQIRHSSYITVQYLKIDGLDVPFIDAVNSTGATHHITLEHLEIVRHGGDQLTVGIATRGPAWDWVVRNNKIIGAGTGIYFGDSDGKRWPFVGGLIENNLFMDTIGYNMQIKHMDSRSDKNGNAIPGMPLEKRKTIIRHNVFSKASQPSSPTQGARPNLLVGHFPLTGPGSDDVYEIYGNFFYENTTEALFQGEGNIALYNNVFINSSGDAVNIQAHNDRPRNINVFHNTVVATGSGIRVSGANEGFEQRVVGNAVFAATPVSAGLETQRDNVTAAYASADDYLLNPYGDPDEGGLDLFPLADQFLAGSIDMTAFTSFSDWEFDFNGDLRKTVFQGAYAGEVDNSGWILAIDIKPDQDSLSGGAPHIITQPTPAMVQEGEDASFSVVASGSAPLVYQWFLNGDEIPGATAASYMLTGVRLSDNVRAFSCRISNGLGFVVSESAALTVLLDDIAPTLVSALVVSETSVNVVFSEAVNAVSAENSNNYQIDRGITVTSARLSSDDRTVSLTVSPLTEDIAYTVSVSNVQDLAESPNIIVAESSKNFTYRTLDDFADGNADGWTELNASRWEVALDNGNMAYFLNTTVFDSPGEGRLGEYSLLLAEYGDFTFTAQAKLETLGSNSLADYAVVFGYRDPGNYDYIMFNNDKDESGIFKVVNGKRTALALENISEPRIDWLSDNHYHSIEVSRKGGEINVSFDGNLIMSATDSAPVAGQVGVGSFNDSAYFDDIRVVEGDGANLVLAIKTTSLADAQVGKVVTYDIDATGGSGGYQWRISEGTLPNGLNLSTTTGGISGRPLPEIAEITTYDFTLEVKDSNEVTASQALSITVAPVVVLAIEAKLLADAQVDEAVTYDIDATGGSGDYHWTISQGRLPDGLELDNLTGEITGAPTSSGTFNFMLKVADSAPEPASATQTFVITVNGVAPAPDNNAGTSSGGGGGALGPLTGMGFMLLLLGFRVVRQRGVI